MINTIKVKYWLYEQLDNESNRACHNILPAMLDGAVVCENEYVDVFINGIKKETEKAVLVEFTEASKSGRTDAWTRWVPKSQIIMEGK